MGDSFFQVQAQLPESAEWETVLEDYFEPTSMSGKSLLFSVPATRIFAALNEHGRHRNHLRIVGEISAGKITSNTFVLYEDGGQPQNSIMAAPWPNPSLGSVKLDLNIPQDLTAKLRIFNMAGQCVFTRDFFGGAQFYLWDGLDNQGQMVSAGTYFLKLDGPGFSESNKVVLLH